MPSLRLFVTVGNLAMTSLRPTSRANGGIIRIE